MVQWFLEQHPDMHICPVERKEGYCPGMPEVVKNGSETLRECVRIFPHRVNGEGHFAVLLQKDEDGESIRAKATPVSMAFSKKKEQARLPQDASAFLQEVQGLAFGKVCIA